MLSRRMSSAAAMSRPCGSSSETTGMPWVREASRWNSASTASRSRPAPGKPRPGRTCRRGSAIERSLRSTPSTRNPVKAANRRGELNRIRCRILTRRPCRNASDNHALTSARRWSVFRAESGQAFTPVCRWTTCAGSGSSSSLRGRAWTCIRTNYDSAAIRVASTSSTRLWSISTTSNSHPPYRNFSARLGSLPMWATTNPPTVW